MEFESPVDAWYVWAGVALGSVLVAGLALGLPDQPPPDANRAANTVDGVSTATYDASATYEHDADEVKIGTKTISMRNDGGTDHASVAFGTMTPVHAIENETRYRTVLRIMRGESPDAVLNETDKLLRWAQEAHAAIDGKGASWKQADGQLRIRRVTVEGDELLLVAA
jgi:hypothetical protein